MAVAQKQCSQCGEVKGTDQFSPRRRECRVCEAARKKRWEKENRDRVNQLHRDWAAANPERARAIKDRWYERSGDVARAKARRRYHADPVTFKVKAKAHYLANAEAVKAYLKLYRVQNREKVNASCRAAKKAKPEKYRLIQYMGVIRRRARKRGLPDAWTRADAVAGLAHFNQACAACLIPFGLVAKAHWDHWIPLTTTTCPGTVPWNMVPLCAMCNLQKRDQPAAAWLAMAFPQRAAQIQNAIETYLSSRRRP